jgi:hypothetical protein
MALVLGMNLEKDNEMWVDDLKVTLDRIMNPDETAITVHGKFMTEKKVISTKGMTTIIPSVGMMLGTDTNIDGFCRVLVDAPKRIAIDRGVKRNP